MINDNLLFCREVQNFLSVLHMEGRGGGGGGAYNIVLLLSVPNLTERTMIAPWQFPTVSTFLDTFYCRHNKQYDGV
jgi:hypothetical protein